MRGLRGLLLVTALLAAALAAGDPQLPPAPAGAPGRDIEDFVPSEQVSADDAVAFPTDI